MIKKPTRLMSVALLAGLLSLSACGSNPPVPTAEVSAARASIESAERSGAGESQPALIKRARDAMTRAEQAIDAEENLRARGLAETAALDAQLAEAKTDADKSEQAANELESGLKSLQQEMKR